MRNEHLPRCPLHSSKPLCHSGPFAPVPVASRGTALTTFLSLNSILVSVSISEEQWPGYREMQNEGSAWPTGQPEPSWGTGHSDIRATVSLTEVVPWGEEEWERAVWQGGWGLT